MKDTLTSHAASAPWWVSPGYSLTELLNGASSENLENISYTSGWLPERGQPSPPTQLGFEHLLHFTETTPNTHHENTFFKALSARTLV